MYSSPFIPVGIAEWLDDRARASLRESGPNVPYRDAVFDRVQVRIFADEPAGEQSVKRPAIVFYHGGGFVHGSPGMLLKTTQKICFV